MNFYEVLSQHYDVIFPRGEKQSSFIKSYLKNGSNILDIGAGIGGYAEYFAELGHKVMAVDLDETMVEGMKHKVENGKIKFDTMQLDMLDIDEFEDSSFDTIFCIGNTLAHLPDYDLVNQFFEKAYNCLKENGHIIVQIVNYDRVLKEKTAKFPAINREDHGLHFTREYEFITEKEVMFKGKLFVKTENEETVFEVETELLAIRKDIILDSVKNLGFREVELFGNFEKAPYNIDSPAIILVAKK